MVGNILAERLPDVDRAITKILDAQAWRRYMPGDRRIDGLAYSRADYASELRIHAAQSSDLFAQRHGAAAGDDPDQENRYVYRSLWNRARDMKRASGIRRSLRADTDHREIEDLINIDGGTDAGLSEESFSVRQVLARMNPDHVRVLWAYADDGRAGRKERDEAIKAFKAEWSL